MRAFRSFAPLFLLAAALFAAASGGGCASLFVKTRLNAADRRFELDAPFEPKRSPGATQTLLARDFDPDEIDLPELSRTLEKIDADPSAELVYAYVETAYFQGVQEEKRRPKLAEEIYLSVALYAYNYMFNPALAASEDVSLFNARRRDVELLYNGACERLTRLILRDAEKARRGRAKSEESADFPLKPNRTLLLNDDASPSLYCRVASGSWRPEEIESFDLAADCEIDSLNFDCRRAGLGVPLVVKRCAGVGVDRPEEAYYPADLSFPATAILRPNPKKPLGSIPPLDPSGEIDGDRPEVDARAPWADATAIFEFHDPLVSTLAPLEGRLVPLETDLTTPLGLFLSTPQTKLSYATGLIGLFHPEKFLETFAVSTGDGTTERTLQGLYLMEPFDPRKIPVAMIHGLGSSPATWLEMYNSLRNVQKIRDNYQFWFYVYPSGRPFWISAAQLRRDLRTIRAELDPDGTAPALDQIVLVGHSMGGLLSRMQVASSGDRIWRKICADASLDDLDFDEKTKNNLRDWFFFEPNPSVRRVVTVATPFEGSQFANGFTERLAESAISLPQNVLSVLATVAKSRPDQIDDPTLLETKTSVESLSPKSPIFAALDECPIPENVALDNIVGVLPSLQKRWINPKKSDGIVDFWSSSRAEIDVEREREVPSPHTRVHTHPAAIFETKEILLRHLEIARAEIAQNALPTADAELDAAEKDDYINSRARRR